MSKLAQAVAEARDKFHDAMRNDEHGHTLTALWEKLQVAEAKERDAATRDEAFAAERAKIAAEDISAETAVQRSKARAAVRRECTKVNFAASEIEKHIAKIGELFTEASNAARSGYHALHADDRTQPASAAFSGFSAKLKYAIEVALCASGIQVLPDLSTIRLQVQRGVVPSKTASDFSRVLLPGEAE